MNVLFIFMLFRTIYLTIIVFKIDSEREFGSILMSAASDAQNEIGGGKTAEDVDEAVVLVVGLLAAIRYYICHSLPLWMCPNLIYIEN